MNQDERQLLDTLLGQLRQSAAGLAPANKDAEAAQQIETTLGQNPDAVYLLVQRHLLMEQALNAAQARIRSLESQSSNGSFLGSTPTNVYGQPLNSAAASAAPATAPAVATAAPRASAGGSFLGAAAATATGVLGGALLFEGIEHLMHGGMGNGMGGYDSPTEVTNITENVYGGMPQDMQDPTGATTGMNDFAPTDQATDWDAGNPFPDDGNNYFGGDGFFDGGDDWV